MKLWQAIVTAQLASGSVWADRVAHGFPAHMLAEGAALLVGIGMWKAAEWAWPSSPNPPEVVQDAG